MLVRPLSPALAEKARRELNEEGPKQLEEGIRHLKQWILKQPHLRARTGNLFYFTLFFKFIVK